MTSKNREDILYLLKEMDNYLQYKKIYEIPVYLLGGSGCVVANYLNRATIDIDILDQDYPSSLGPAINMLGEVYNLDLYLTTVPMTFMERSVKIEGFKSIDVYVLAREDIITTKIGRYSAKDKEDITKLIKECDIPLLTKLFIEVEERDNISKIIKNEFLMNKDIFRRDFNV